MNFTLFTADTVNAPNNCVYPNKQAITDETTLAQAVCHDYVCGAFRNHYRNRENFLSADCLAVDCDNDHSEQSGDWVTPAHVAQAFPNIAFAVHYSRSHLVSKNGKAPRPKFHVLFPIEPITDATVYSEMKQMVSAIFPYFDTNALDAPRFFFGTANPKVEWHPGSLTLSSLFSMTDFDADMDSGLYGDLVISQGSRNATMSHMAGKLLKRFGDGETAYQHYLEVAVKCDPPLEQGELDTIWHSAQRFYGKISAQEGYIPPEQYNQDFSLQPTDYSDVGQAMVLEAQYAEKLRYSSNTDYLVYNGSFWEESTPKSQAVMQELTTRQLEEAEVEIQKAVGELTQNGGWDLLATMGAKRAVSAFNPVQARSYLKYETALAYQKFSIKRRDSKYITSALKEARPHLLIEPRELDAAPFLLNTPSATYNLETGGLKPHDATDFITKQTAVDPSEDGKELWISALETFFQMDYALMDYVQEIVGLAAIGKGCLEALIIAYGEGRNGKSTFWNTVSRVLGSYSGNMSADTLTVGCKRNVKPELAEAKGKRLLIAAELEEGMRLSTSNVKQLCSTDEIYAEKKYKDPFSYVPTHTLVLYTNHLPKVGAIDAGTWRRLIVIPFGAKIESNDDVKNYADTLFEQAGGAILSWILEGAQRVIAKQYKITQPKVVADAIAKYREGNDWFAHLFEECCEAEADYQAKSGEVYTAYRSYCTQVGDYIRSTTDFYVALEQAGFQKKRSKLGVFVTGLRLKPDFLE